MYMYRKKSLCAWPTNFFLLLICFFRAEAKLLEETARPLIDTLGKPHVAPITAVWRESLWVCYNGTLSANN